MDKRKKAVAIKYDREDTAPKVIASGKGAIAENILDKAEEEKISIVEDEALVNELTKVDIGDYIPEELYEVVAKVLLFVTDMDKRRDKFL